MTSRKNSSRLPARSFAWSDSPVTLPPGFARLCDQAAADRIDPHRKHNGDYSCCLPYDGDGASDCVK
jgi:hypothetical protein